MFYETNSVQLYVNIIIRCLKYHFWKYLLEDYLEDAKNQNLIKSVHVQAEHDDDKPVNETAWLQDVADKHSSNLPSAIVAYADFSKNNISEILDAHRDFKNMSDF